MPAPPPNILWIVTTQWRAHATGYAGDRNARTPSLDRLAAEGMNFAQAVTPHPFGPFARAALLTGVLSPANGVCDYHDPLPVEARTIAHEMRARGYATAFFGKWHLGKRDPRAPLVGEAHARVRVPPESRGGFEWWEGFEGGFLLNDPLLHGTGLAEPTRFSGYQSDVLCDRAGRWAARAAPWFCVLSLEPPHPPYGAPSAGVVPPGEQEIALAPNVPRGGGAEGRARRELAGYYAHIAATDRAIGKLLASMPAAETAVVFTSVHGDMHGAHGLFRKGWPYEESVRVPLLVRHPAGRGKAGDPAPESRLVSLLELGRWSLGWTEGRRPELETSAPGGEFQRISMPSVVALPDQCDRVWRGVRNRDRKLVLNADGSPWLYFDLGSDPGETVNLAADRSRANEIADLGRRI